MLTGNPFFDKKSQLLRLDKVVQEKRAVSKKVLFCRDNIELFVFAAGLCYTMERKPPNSQPESKRRSTHEMSGKNMFKQMSRVCL